MVEWRKTMDWSTRTVSDKFRVERYKIRDLILYYIDGTLIVNRRYQRKLVWGMRDKQLLIDSLLQQIPLPALLISTYDIPDGIDGVHEIVDGVQRISAIVSFCLGEFGVKYKGELCYFDPEANIDTRGLKRENDSRLILRENYLPLDVCKRLERQELAVIETGQDDDTVNLIFSRINSTGRKISSQDLRQSSATGEFADVVRRIASDVRMDNTYSDHVCLSDIKQISVGDKKLGYGVDLDSTFWRRHDILINTAVIESGDEEVIETLIASKFIPGFKKTKDSLDDLYHQGTKRYKEIEECIKSYDKCRLEESFKKVFDIIDMIFDSVNSNFSEYLFKVKRTRNKDKCFGVLFLAIERLLSDGYFVEDYEAIAISLRKSSAIFDKIVREDNTSYVLAEDDIETFYRVLKPACSIENRFVNNEFVEEIEKRLGYSKFERQMTEFKIGLSSFDSKKFNPNTIMKVSRALVAMANVSEPNEEGLIIVGVADTFDSYRKWKNEYNATGFVCGQHCITGIEEEAEKMFGSIDNYIREVRKKISAQQITDELKEYVLEHFETVNFYGRTLLVFKVKSVPGSHYEDEKFVRHGNESTSVKGNMNSMSLF